MEINYLQGTKKEFYEFVNLITPRDRVAILLDSDLDGLACGIFLEEILEAKNVGVNYVDFLDRKNDMIKEVSMKLKEMDITKVFFCDIGIDSIDFEGFVDLKKEIDVFLIDHHPSNEKIEEFDKIIKTVSGDCSAMTVFELGDGLIDREEWSWLNCAAIFADYSYKSEKNFEYIKSVYPEVTMENISSSIPGMNGRKIAAALIYYDNNKKYVYTLVKERKMEEITEVHGIIEEEINELVDGFSEKKEYFEKKDLYFYEVDSKYRVLSTVTSIVSKMRPESNFVFMQRDGDTYKFSARSQGQHFDMSALMKRCVEGLEDATGGGHIPAAAARIKVEDLEAFKERLVN